VKDAIAAEQRERRTPDDAPPKKKLPPGDQKDIVDECSVDIDASVEPTEPDEEFSVLDDPNKASPRPIPQDDPLSDEMRDVDERINVKGILDCVRNPDKRMAFHLFMDGVPYKSKKKNVESIAQALGISEKTAREWVKEVRQLLAEHEGVKHLRKMRVGARS
jgi:DNA-directed RNA polymerase specialized sigma24 family protein